MKEKATEHDLRSMLGRAANENSDEIVNMLKDSLTQQKLVWAYCPDCHKKVRVEYPDFNNATKLLQLWLDQGFGKASTGTAGKTSAAAPDLGKPLEKMSKAERDGYAAHLVAKFPKLQEEFRMLRESS